MLRCIKTLISWLRAPAAVFLRAIADAIFALGGVVYGVTMQRDMQVQHMRIESPGELWRLRGSKYVQSDTGNTFQRVENDLKNGLTVLFSGTPCQIDGLKQFLGKEYDNLYTVDIVCHGVGSQAYFDKYLESARKRYGDVHELCFVQRSSQDGLAAMVLLSAFLLTEGRLNKSHIVILTIITTPIFCPGIFTEKAVISANMPIPTVRGTLL